jgi:hypothetical protein
MPSTNHKGWRWLWPRPQPPSAPPLAPSSSPGAFNSVRVMYDSTTPSAIPAGAELVAGYINGLYEWSDGAWALWPRARLVRISVRADDHRGDVIDVERGDATPQSARAWVVAALAAGARAPIVYSNRSTGPELEAALGGLRWRWWCADWTGHPHTVSGAVAVQYASPGIGSSIHADLSIVTESAFPA